MRRRPGGLRGLLTPSRARGGIHGRIRARVQSRVDGRFQGRQGRAGRDRGASAVELAIVAPGLLLLIFLGVQTGLWLFGRNVAEQSAREAVSRLRVTVVGADLASATAAARIQAENYVRNVGGNLVQDPTATADQVGEARVRVTVTGSAISLVPGLSFTVTGSAEGDVEQFQVDE